VGQGKRRAHVLSDDSAGICAIGVELIVSGPDGIFIFIFGIFLPLTDKLFICFFFVSGV
jgi:hypothetical protein